MRDVSGEVPLSGEVVGVEVVCPSDSDPRACWALIETSAEGVSVEFRRVEYDVERVAQAILGSDLPDEFAGQLREARGYLPVPA